MAANLPRVSCEPFHPGLRRPICCTPVILALLRPPSICLPVAVPSRLAVKRGGPEGHCHHRPALDTLRAEIALPQSFSYDEALLVDVLRLQSHLAISQVVLSQCSQPRCGVVEDRHRSSRVPVGVDVMRPRTLLF
jgi:hypothetical protein